MLPTEVGGGSTVFDSSTEADAALLRRCWNGFDAGPDFVVKGDRGSAVFRKGKTSEDFLVFFCTL